MIELRTLGTLDLRDGAMGEIRRVLAQPKRLALLVYLALAPAAPRRDSLLALFWPELDQGRARLALRQAVHGSMVPVVIEDTHNAHWSPPVATARAYPRMASVRRPFLRLDHASQR